MKVIDCSWPLPVRFGRLRPRRRVAAIAGGHVASGTVQLGNIAHQDHTIDRKNGFRTGRSGLCGQRATRVAFEGGEADTMVADWIWVPTSVPPARIMFSFPIARSRRP